MYSEVTYESSSTTRPCARPQPHTTRSAEVVTGRDAGPFLHGHRQWLSLAKARQSGPSLLTGCLSHDLGSGLNMQCLPNSCIEGLIANAAMVREGD